MDAELVSQVAREWLGHSLDEAAKTARRLDGLLAELRSMERVTEAPAFGFDPLGPIGSRDRTGGAPTPAGWPTEAAGGESGRPHGDGEGAHRGAGSGAQGESEALLDLPAGDLVRLVQEGQVSAVAVTRAALARIERLDPQVNAFVTRLPDRALAQAEALDSAIRMGENPGPLAGLPIGLKDLIDVAGIPTTACSPMRREAIAETDAAVTTLLAKAGAILVGKTATHEWAYGTTCDSRLHGSTRNPGALDHSPGGSSGGSAAAVAAGMLGGALGTDTAGSLRIPAACCGVVGFKPTFGRISRVGVLPLSHSLDHVGPIGRTVADVARLYATLAGEGLEPLLAESPRPISGLSIGLPVEWLASGPIDPWVLAAFNQGIKVLEGHGARIVPVALPSLALGHFISRILTLAEGAAVHAGNLNRLAEYPPDVRARLELGQFVLARDYLLAQQLRTRYCREMEVATAGVDLVITPTQPIPAPRLDQRTWTYSEGAPEAVAEALTRFVAPANVTGEPAISLPCRLTGDRLPIGLQLIGHPGADLALLRVAGALEAALRGQSDG